MHPTHLFVLTGDPDTCRRKEQWYREGFQKKYGPHAPIEIIDAEEAPLSDVQALLSNQSLFSEKRMVVIRGIPLSTTTKKKNAKELEEYIARHSDRLDPETVFVFVSPAADKRKSLYKSFAKAKHIQTCAAIEGAALPAMIEQLAPGTFTPGLQRMLIEQVGGQEQAVRQAVEKVTLYAGEHPITAEMIGHVCARYEEPNIFGLMDALSEKRLKASIHALDVLLSGGEDLFMVLSMCIRQYRILLFMKAAQHKDTMASTLKLHPFVAKKTASYIRHYTIAQLKSAYQELLDIDTAIKTGAIRTSTEDQRELRTALEVFIANACA